MMRGIDTTVRRLRRRVFEEVARLGFKANADTLNDDMEAIPYKMVNEETQKYRESVYRARCGRARAVSGLPWDYPCARRMKASTPDRRLGGQQYIRQIL